MLHRPHPDDFTVAIEERPDGTWLVRVNEAPEFCGEGASLDDALAVIEHQAMAPLCRLSVSDRIEVQRGMAALAAAREWAEDFLDARDSDAAMAEAGESIPWEQVKHRLGL